MNQYTWHLLQGFTDFVYRQCFHRLFGTVREYYIPYISLGPGAKVRNSQIRDLLPENNEGIPVVPQILCKNGEELKELCKIIQDYGYQKLNLNLGCPYPMATKRGRGTALLEDEDKLKEVLDILFSDFNFKTSVKFRSGLESENTIFNRVELLNSYPFEKLIFHPRTASQMYKGVANRELFVKLNDYTELPLVYNGDIQCIDDLKSIRELVSGQNEWMIGRGILSNPFLPDELNGVEIDPQQRHEKLVEFHQLILDEYLKVWADQGIVLKRMEQFWSYFSSSFKNGKKLYKVAAKSRSIDKYTQGIKAFLMYY